MMCESHCFLEIKDLVGPTEELDKRIKRRKKNFLQIPTVRQRDKRKSDCRDVYLYRVSQNSILNFQNLSPMFLYHRILGHLVHLMSLERNFQTLEFKTKSSSNCIHNFFFKYAVYFSYLAGVFFLIHWPQRGERRDMPVDIEILSGKAILSSVTARWA